LRILRKTLLIIILALTAVPAAFLIKLQPDYHVEINMKTGFERMVMLKFDIFLKTISSSVPLDENAYWPVVADYYKLRYPSGWIEAMKLLSREDIRLLNCPVNPPCVKPPYAVNEADASDSSAFTLRTLGVALPKASSRLRAKIYESKFLNSTSTLLVTVMNTGDDEGVFIVILFEKSFEQARKVDLKPGENASVRFPVHVPEGEEVVVRIFGGGEQLDECKLTIGMKKPPSILPLVLGVVGTIPMLVGTLVILSHFMGKFRKHASLQEDGPAPYPPS